MKKVLGYLFIMLLLVGCQQSSNKVDPKPKEAEKKQSNITTETHDVTEEEKEVIIEKKKTSNKQVIPETESKERIVDVPKNDQVNTSKSSTKPKENEVDTKPINTQTEEKNEEQDDVTSLNSSQQPVINPSEEKEPEPTPAPPACNDSIPSGTFRTEQEAANYAQGALMDNMLNGDGTLSGYELEWSQNECGTTYYIVKIY